jgi:hypothetical protein
MQRVCCLYLFAVFPTFSYANAARGVTEERGEHPVAIDSVRYCCAQCSQRKYTGSVNNSGALILLSFNCFEKGKIQ